jgi:mannose-1-phosphate guanylyltransferase/mannose-6-phosphate isomerase
VTTAALFVAQSDPRAVMLVLAADSHIERPAAFLAAVATGTPAAEAGALVMFGVAPSRPETGYGYIQIGAPLAGAAGVRHVDAFLEKPDQATAEAFAASGRHLWNSGNFLFRADVMLGEIERLEPALLAAGRMALARARPHHGYLLLDRAALLETAVSSIDRALMEHTDRAAVVPADMGWSDVGSWNALWDVSSKDAEGNVVAGDVLLEDVRGSYVRGTGRLVAAVGIEDIVIVETDDVVFVAPRARAAEAKGLVERLTQAARPEAANHTSVYRPWGSYRSVDRGDRFQVKRIIVKPGGRLSAQWHHHRAEHWIIVQGTAKVTVGEETRLLHENESVYVPAGTVHRLENPGQLPLHLIEVQTGSYLGEDDIVRLDDDYGRR